VSYVLNSYKWGETQYGRTGGTITFGFDAAFYSGLELTSDDIGAFEDAAAEALATWTSVAQLTFVASASAADADILFTAADLPGSQVGEALTTFVEAGVVDQVTEAVVTFDADRTWSPFGESGMNFYNVALHEVGHTLGLGHPPDATDEVMYAFYLSDETLSLGPGDIAGIQYIYGSARAVVTGSLEDNVIDRSSWSDGLTIFALAGDDTVTGSQAQDEISGGAGNDRLFGLGGDDLIFDFAGANTLDGGDGADVLLAGIGRNEMSGGAGDDLILGGIGSDTLLGGNGSDVLVGDPDGFDIGGNDRIDGGAGSDLLMGGAGADVFVFADTGGNDTIARLDIDYLSPVGSTPTGEDFTPGLDKIELAAGTFADATALFNAMDTVGGSAVITLGGTTMTIFGVTETELSADDFIFAGAVV